MVKNYFKTAVRSLYKHKGFTIINIFGLSIGIAMAILLGSYIQFELSYDQHYQEKERIYRVYQETNINGRERTNISGSGMMAPTLASLFPEIEIAGRSHRFGSAVIAHEDNRFIENSLAFADEGLLEILEIEFLEGTGSLSEPADIVLSELLAKKVFGTASGLVGQTIVVNDESKRIIGIYKNLPGTSHYSPRTGFLSNAAMNAHSWTRVGHLTYIKVLEGTDLKSLESKFVSIVKDNILPVLPEGSTVKIKLQPITDIWLSESDGLNGGGSRQALTSFALIGIFILLIASINYMNLATARSLRRVKEIGMRKVIGAKKQHLIFQFLTESIVLCLASILFGGFLAEMSNGIFNDLTGRAVEIRFLENSSLFIAMIAFGLLLGVLSGLYPAFYISSFKPIRVLKGANIASKANRNVRRVLVSLQFIISIGLIVSTLVVYKQSNYLIEKDLGYNSEQVLSVRLAESDTSEIMKRALLSVPNVSAVTATNLLPATGDSGATFKITDENGDEHRDVVSMASIDNDYLETMEFRMVSGRNFSKEIVTDEKSIIVNETLVSKYGWQEPLGKTITMDIGDQGTQVFTIIGVVEDFNMLSLYQPVKPFAFFKKPTFDWGAQYLFAKISMNNIEATIDEIGNVYESIEKNRPFNSIFIDDYFERVYSAETKKGEVYLTFSILTIVIACIGLFGLATFVLQQKTKEIGIRKVLGAQMSDIISLVSKEFIYIVILASTIASPLAYYFMQDWLQTFEYQISISFGIFILAGLSALFMAVLTISIQSIKTARVNAAETLKYE